MPPDWSRPVCAVSRVRRRTPLLPSRCAAFLIAETRLTENSTWDERTLGEQLKILLELDLDFDLETIGFEIPEIDLLIDGPFGDV
jgi:hypothetical protein